MSHNSFINKLKRPTRSQLAEALGRSIQHWDALIEIVANEFDVVDCEWKSYSPKSGWSMRLIKKKRNIVYLSPGKGSFAASIVLGDRAIRALQDSTPSKSLVKVLAGSQRYPEGTAIRIAVKGPGDIETVKRLIAAKIST